MLKCKNKKLLKYLIKDLLLFKIKLKKKKNKQYLKGNHLRKEENLLVKVDLVIILIKNNRLN